MRIVKVYVLTSEWDCNDEGYSIEAVFSSLVALRDYVAIKHPGHVLDSDGNYVSGDPNNKEEAKHYLSIQEKDLMESETMSKELKPGLLKCKSCGNHDGDGFEPVMMEDEGDPKHGFVEFKCKKCGKPHSK